MTFRELLIERTRALHDDLTGNRSAAARQVWLREDGQLLAGHTMNRAGRHRTELVGTYTRAVDFDELVVDVIATAEEMRLC